MFEKYKKNKQNMCKNTIRLILLLLAMSCLIIVLTIAWNTQYRHGLSHQPFCGEIDESGLTLLGKIDGCDIYMYNMKELSFVTWRGNRKSMLDVLEGFTGSKEDIFPVDGETKFEIISGHPTRVNRYEALVSLDFGGAIVFMHYTQDLNKVYQELKESY